MDIAIEMRVRFMQKLEERIDECMHTCSVYRAKFRWPLAERSFRWQRFFFVRSEVSLALCRAKLSMATLFCGAKFRWQRVFVERSFAGPSQSEISLAMFYGAKSRWHFA